MALKQQQIEKYNILIALQGELNAIHDEQKYCKKLRTKQTQAAQNKRKDEQNLMKLQDISKQQKIQIKKITTEIQTLRLKIKPQHQFLLDKRVAAGRKTPPILSFPREYVADGADGDDQESMPSSTKSFSSNASSVSTESDISLPSKASSTV